MLCCVSKKSSAAADPGAAESTSDRCSRVASLILSSHSNDLRSNSKSHLTATGIGTREEEDPASRFSLRETADVPTILLPCAICARTFKPQSLEKHRRICERSAIKKRKPFDSAKQRIQGTELAEFAPKRENRRSSQDGSQERIQDRSPKSKSAWKQTHDQLLRTLREARRENVDVPPPRRQKTGTSAPASMTSGAPTRANEKGTCPTCNRQFGIKAYDRHVAWCKERAIRVPLSPATNVAKERLEARMKYRAPILKNRRALNREKYSLGSAVHLNTVGYKTSPTSSTTAAKESLSMPACNKIHETVLNPTTGRHLSRGGKPIAAPLTSGSSKYCSVDRNNGKVREASSLASKYVWKSERTRPNEDGASQAVQAVQAVRLNDVTVNKGVIGMTVRPCNVYRVSSHSDIVAVARWKRTARTETTILQRDSATIANERCDDSPRRTSSRVSEATSDRVTTLLDDKDLDLTYSIVHSSDGDQPEGQDRTDETVDLIDTSKENTRSLETTGEHPTIIPRSAATRCATYVIEEASGEKMVLRQKMEIPRRNPHEEEEIVAITSSEEALRPRICEKYVNGNFECESEEESHGKKEAVPTSTKASSERRRMVNQLRKDVDSRTTSARVTERKIRERMRILRGSTDSLISSIERTDRTERANGAASTEVAYEVEQVEQVEQVEHLPAIVPNDAPTRKAPVNCSSYWEKVSRVVENRREVKSTERLLVRNRKIESLPPVIPSPKPSQPNFHSDVGTSAESIDPFYLAERQMNELSSTDTPDRSIDDPTVTNDSPSTLNSSYPLSRSPSAFVKYVGHLDLNRNSSSNRSSVIAPPSQFDDLTSSEFSSDSTETNSLSREIFAEAFGESAATKQHRVVIDKSRTSKNLQTNSNSNRAKTLANSRKIIEKVSGKIARPTVDRSQSVRSSSASRPPPLCQDIRKMRNPQAPEKQIANGKKKIFISANRNSRNPMSSSNLSLSSIVSSELDVKRSNSVLDEFTNSFEDDDAAAAAVSSSYPLLRSFLKTDSTSALSSPIDGSDRANAQRNSEDDEENLSSPDSYKRHDSDRARHTVDSAYSSLNRKYSNHGRSGEDVGAFGSRRFYEEDVVGAATPLCKMSKFCHECGSRFPETAKFCCECGVRRLAF